MIAIYVSPVITILDIEPAGFIANSLNDDGTLFIDPSTAEEGDISDAAWRNILIGM